MSIYTAHDLRACRVLRVHEDACEVWGDRGNASVAFASIFPAPRVERVSPGHVVAVATGPADREVVVWRWYDAVVLGTETDGSVRLWEPAHGEVLARPRPSYPQPEPGTRAYASAGLPGADWWVAGGVAGSPTRADVELDEVAALFTDNDLWSTVFAPGS